MFYSYNKEVALDKVIFSGSFQKIESQLCHPGSSSGQLHRRVCCTFQDDLEI